eukprot:825746-Rhodomonas_salina.2
MRMKSVSDGMASVSMGRLDAERYLDELQHFGASPKREPAVSSDSPGRDLLHLRVTFDVARKDARSQHDDGHDADDVSAW